MLQIYSEPVHMVCRLSKMLKAKHFYASQHLKKMPLRFHSPQIPFNQSETLNVKC